MNDDDDDADENDDDDDLKTYASHLVEDEEVRKIICEELKKKDHRPIDIIQMRFCREVKGFAWFYCSCNRQWPSAHAWCIVDLNELTISLPLPTQQACRDCESWIYPNFDGEAIKRMAAYAVKCCLIKMGLLDKEPSMDTDRIDTQGPHDEERCRKCIKKGRSCWKK